VQFSFAEGGYLGYLDGTTEAPDADGKKLMEWKEYNRRIIGTLGQIIDDLLAQELEMDMTAADAWRLLKKRTHQDGMVAKLNAMQTAIKTKFSPSKSMTVTIAEIRDLLSSIYEGGVAPTREDWFIVLMLNSLDGTEYDWVRKSLVTQFASAKTAPSEKVVIEVINSAGYEKRHGDQANVFKASKDSNPKKKCTNCGNPQHAFESCWTKGGGAAGKAPDWWKEAQEKRNGSGKGKSKSDKANAAKDGEGDDNHTKSANLTIDVDFLKDRFADGYISCPAIDSPQLKPVSTDTTSTETIDKWSGSWTAATTRSPVGSCDISPLTKEERANSAYEDFRSALTLVVRVTAHLFVLTSLIWSPLSIAMSAV
jgi:hypothetical protein